MSCYGIVVECYEVYCFFFFSSRRRHTRLQGDWSSDVCSSDLTRLVNSLRTSTLLPMTTNGFLLFGGPCFHQGSFETCLIRTTATKPVRAKFEIGRASCRERV